MAVAATAITSPPVTGKAGENSGGVLKLAANNGSCAKGTKSITLLGKGGPGTALGYAHIKPGGTFDAARSYNVTAANVVTNRAGFYCFKGLNFTPRNAVVTLDYNGILNGQISTATLKLPATPSDCGLSSAQAEVFTGLVTSGTFTSGVKLGFYIVFY